MQNSRKSSLSILFAALCASGSFVSMSAAELSGVVTAQSTGTALEGVVVTIPQLNEETTTNRRGFYEFNDLPTGSYTVRFRYVSAVDKEESVVVTNAEVLRLETSLSLNIFELDAFEVNAKSTATARAINIQRASVNLTDLVASDLFGQFADGNAAEALNRLPGVSIERDQGEGRFVIVRGIDPNLNSVAIDGVTLAAPSADQRSTLLDTIPIEVLDTLEVTKAVLPSQPGDSIGGYINLRSPSAFSFSERTTTLSASLLYSDLVEETGFKAFGSYGNTFGKEDQWGLYLTLITSERTFGSDNVEADPWEDDVTEEIQFREYNLTRERTGLSANLEYKPTDDSLFFLRTSYNNYKDTELRDLAKMVFDGAFFDVTTNSFGHQTEDDVNEDDMEVEYPGIATELELKEREENMRIFVASIGGEQRLGHWTLDYTLAYSKAEEDTPFDYEVVYATAELDATDGIDPDPAFVGLGGAPIFTQTNTLTPRLNAPSAIAAYTGVNYADPTVFEFDELTIGEQLVKETDTSGQINLQHDFDQETLKYIKFGGLYRMKEKESDFDQVSADDDTGIQTADLYINPNTRNPFNRPVPSLHADIFDFAIENLPFETDDVDSIIEDYKTNEDVSAAYFMAGIDLGQWHLIAGARIEHTAFETEGVAFNDDTGAISAVKFENDYTSFLPGIHVRRQFGDEIILRASWTNTIARPTFEQSRPGIVREGNEVERGNPDLNPYEAMNFDISIQYNSERFGNFGAAIFYKDIENFIYEQTFEENEDEVTTFQNGETGDILGLELSYSKLLGFLPGPLSGISVSGNLTLTQSSADAERPNGGGLAALSFIRQSDVIGNVSIAWEYQRYLIRLSASYRDDYLDEIGEEAFEDRYIDDFLIFDLYTSVKVYKALSLFLEINNLTNEPFQAYWGESGRLSQFEEYGISGSVGAKWSF